MLIAGAKQSPRQVVLKRPELPKAFTGGFLKTMGGRGAVGCVTLGPATHHRSEGRVGPQTWPANCQSPLGVHIWGEDPSQCGGHPSAGSLQAQHTSHCLLETSTGKRTSCSLSREMLGSGAGWLLMQFPVGVPRVPHQQSGKNKPSLWVWRKGNPPTLLVGM